jgi:tRNA-dihydrouridine synthase
VKTRLGWNHEQLIITELAEQLQDCGIKALTIHGRTRSQMYTGEADWTLIGEVKRNPRITIPIIGNGDITSAAKACEAFDRYGVDAIMVGRATFGCPWIFKEINDALTPTPPTACPAVSPLVPPLTPHPSPLTSDDKLDILEELLRINVERIDEPRGIIHTRRHLAATPIFKGIANFRPTRIAMLRATHMDELIEIMESTRKLGDVTPLLLPKE